METTIKIVANKDGIYLVFEDEEQAEAYAIYLPYYQRITSYGNFMNAILL